MDKIFIHNLVSRIVAEVLRRVEQERLKQYKPEDILVLLAGVPPDAKQLERYLQAQLGPVYTTVQLPAPSLLEKLSAAKTVVLVSPSHRLLAQIAAGDDGDASAAPVVRAILWQKDVRIALDFEPPRYQRNSFLASVSESVQTLRSMNVQVDCYLSGRVQNPRRDFVTEQDVLDCAGRGEKTILCTPRAIITPAARDALMQTGVELVY